MRNREGDKSDRKNTFCGNGGRAAKSNEPKAGESSRAALKSFKSCSTNAKPTPKGVADWSPSLPALGVVCEYAGSWLNSDSRNYFPTFREDVGPNARPQLLAPSPVSGAVEEFFDL